MAHRALLLAGCLTVIIARTAAGIEPEKRATGLQQLVASLDLTERGAARWLERLGVDDAAVASERLLAVNAAGDVVMQRDGGRSDVRVGPELDRLLLQPGRSIVLIHNHPSNLGLSADDIGQLARPAVAAVVAIGHDGSVFVAAPGPRMDPHFLIERQYAAAHAEVLRCISSELSGRVRAAERDALFGHLVARALAKAGIIDYWFTLRGVNRTTYDRTRAYSGRIVESVAARLRRAR